MKVRTKKQMAAQKVEPERRDMPQLDTPLGRVELDISGPDHVQARWRGG
jgi:hypothetical protein